MTCDYCRGVGACPQCWGRANIEELKAERDQAVSLLREYTEAVVTEEVLPRLTERARAFLKEVDND